jgi:hypothetical protein
MYISAVRREIFNNLGKLVSCGTVWSENFMRVNVILAIQYVCVLRYLVHARALQLDNAGMPGVMPGGCPERHAPGSLPYDPYMRNRQEQGKKNLKILKKWDLNAMNTKYILYLYVVSDKHLIRCTCSFAGMVSKPDNVIYSIYQRRLSYGVSKTIPKKTRFFRF